jgi:hypothetical protein
VTVPFLSIQKERSKVFARSIVDRGKRWFLIRATWLGGIVFWLGMNSLFLTRHDATLRGRFLFGWEVVFLLLSMFFGLVDSVFLWSRIKRIANSD